MISPTKKGKLGIMRNNVTERERENKISNVIRERSS